MRILIEGHQYEAAKVKDVLHGIDALENVEGLVSVNYVGYFYNTHKDVKDCVFILPKVLLEDKDGEERVFGEYEPEKIINPDRNELLKEEERRFVYEFAVWIYRTIAVYKNSNPKSDIVYQKKVTQAGRGRRRQSDTFLDIILAMIQFNRENRNFFFFVLRNLHSGFNKINWTRTISKSTAIVQDNSPVYLDTVNKKRQINFDEELLVIFFSILNYIGDKYGFNKDISCNFQLIKGKQFENYINGLGRKRLLQIKYKYFSDKALTLWELCYAFFDHARQARVNESQQEYVLVKNFNIVFESIIDELISDSPLPDGMDKKQEDGKIVDHLFKDRSLIENKEKFTYYIGDSKYYKIGHELGPESIFKQYTYARNVIQWNLDIFNNGRTPASGIRLRDDELTEGYNIIPNFFISAKMDNTFDYANGDVERANKKKNQHQQVHFYNRLFDRDTLLLFHYDVNFLFVVSLYARNNALQKAGWKEKMRNIFREDIQNWLETYFNFYAMKPLPGNNAETYIKEHFRDMIGKVYTPYSDRNILSLALDKAEKYKKENEDLLAELRQHFIVMPCALGVNPEEAISKEYEKVFSKVTSVQAEGAEYNGVLMVMMENFDTRSKNFLSHGKLAIGLKSTIDTINIVDNRKHIGYVLFHTRSDDNKHLFAVNGSADVKSANDVEEERYKNVKEANVYLVVDLDLSYELPAASLRVSNVNFTSATKYDAQYATIETLIGAIGSSIQHKDNN